MATTWLTEKSAWTVFALAVVGMVLGMWFKRALWAADLELLFAVD